MKKLIMMAITLIISGCAASGASYESLKEKTETSPDENARIVFYRTKESSLYIGRKAPVDVDDKKTGACAYGGYFYRELPPGKYALKTEIWDMPGECELTLDASAGDIYYFKVDPRSESFTAFMIGGVIGNAVESSGKKCGGAFKLYPASEEVAQKEMMGLKLSE